MPVYVAQYGYDYEGSTIVGVFSSEEAAAKALEPFQSYGDWRLVFIYILDEVSPDVP